MASERVSWVSNQFGDWYFSADGRGEGDMVSVGSGVLLCAVESGSATRGGQSNRPASVISCHRCPSDDELARPGSCDSSPASTTPSKLRPPSLPPFSFWKPPPCPAVEPPIFEVKLTELVRRRSDGRTVGRVGVAAAAAVEQRQQDRVRPGHRRRRRGRRWVVVRSSSSSSSSRSKSWWRRAGRNLCTSRSEPDRIFNGIARPSPRPPPRRPRPRRGHGPSTDEEEGRRAAALWPRCLIVFSAKYAPTLYMGSISSLQELAGPLCLPLPGLFVAQPTHTLLMLAETLVAAKATV